MALSIFKVKVASQWAIKKAITGFTSNRYTASLEKSISPTVDVTHLTDVYFLQTTLAAGASQTFDMTSLVDPVDGHTIVGARFYSIQVWASGASCRVQPGASNAFVGFWGASTDQINLGTSGQFSLADTTAYTIDGTHKTIKVTNTHGTATLTFAIALGLGV